MERYIIREPRVIDYPQNMQNTNHESTDEEFLERSFRPNQNFPHNVSHTVYMPYTPASNNQDFGNVRMNSSSYMPICISPAPGQVVSGIDPRYLAAYADPNANFIAAGQQIQRERGINPANTAFRGDYQNSMSPAPERNTAKTFAPKGQQIQRESGINPANTAFRGDYQNSLSPAPERNTAKTFAPKEYLPESPRVLETLKNDVPTIWKPMNNTPAPIKKIETLDVHKSEIQNQIMSRADKLKALHKSGTRVFSGPVEKVLKWHKALQDVGVYVLYEIVAKCVSVRPGEQCTKSLVVRDENGPAMQIVYYEVDFLLPELKPPCTIRIIGRMMAGTSRFQAFNVRLATGDDVATLPRRAAVAAHHIAKLFKEYA